MFLCFFASPILAIVNNYKEIIKEGTSKFVLLVPFVQWITLAISNQLLYGCLHASFTHLQKPYKVARLLSFWLLSVQKQTNVCKVAEAIVPYQWL